jgi:hypothetical protein
VSNVRRIQRYLETKIKGERQQNTGSGGVESIPQQPVALIFAFVKAILAAFRSLARPSMLCLNW